MSSFPPLLPHFYPAPSPHSFLLALFVLQDGSIVLEKFGSVETGPLANVLACEGKPGKVKTTLIGFCLSLCSTVQLVVSFEI